MLFNRLNTNTYAHQKTDGVCYVHKKFGVIKETKLKMQDGVTNQPKRFKVEPRKSKTNGPGKKAIIVGRKTETKIKNKPLDMPDLSSPPLTSRQTKVKRIEPLKRPSRPVLNDISEKPLQPMVEPRIKRIKPLKGPCRPVPQPLQQLQPRGPAVLRKYLDYISAMPPKPLQPMVEPCFKRIEPLKGPFRPVPLPLLQPLKGPFRPVPLPLQQQNLRGSPMLGKYLNDVSAMPSKPLQPMIEPYFKRIEPLKGSLRPIPLPLQQQHLRGPPMLGNYLNDVSAMPSKPLQSMVEPCIKRLELLKGPFRPVPLPLLQPLKGLFRPVPLPLQYPLKGPFRPLPLSVHQQPISVLGKQLEDIKKMHDESCIMCKIKNPEPNMTIPHLTNTTLRSANKENLIKKPKEKYFVSDSKEANAKKPSNKRKMNKETTPRLSPGVVKAKIETPPTAVKGKQKNCQQPMHASDSKQANAKKTLNKRKYNKETTSRSPPGIVKAKVETPSLTAVKGKQKKLQQAVQASNSKQASAKKQRNKRKYNKRTIETPSQQNLEQAVQAPTLNSHYNLPNELALHKFPFVALPRPLPLLFSKLPE